MANENGTWIMRGRKWHDPERVRSWEELITKVEEVGFLPLFANEIRGFSVEENVSPDFWWTGDREQDPWEWREIIAASHRVAYGKFFDKKAGFISIDWLPYFVNYRREGYDFDARWEDGLSSRREKKIMDLLTARDEEGEVTFPPIRILSTELKKKAGFGKEGEKNYPGVITALQMQTYLVITDFYRRTNKKGEEYGMPVSVLLPPESLWGYEKVTSAYTETPLRSRERIMEHMHALYPEGDDKRFAALIGRKP